SGIVTAETFAVRARERDREWLRRDSRADPPSARLTITLTEMISRETMAKRKHFVVWHPHRLAGKPVVGDPQGNNIGQCAQLAQQNVQMPRTAAWKPGKRVMDCKPGELTPGTVLAMFHNGQYLNMSGINHTVLYVGHSLDKSGHPNMLTVVHQFPTCGGSVLQEKFHFGPNGSAYQA